MEDVWALRVETVRGSWEKPGLRGLSGGGPCSELGKRETKMGRGRGWRNTEFIPGHVGFEMLAGRSGEEVPA